MDGLKIVVQKMCSADIDELLKAAAILAEQDCVALLGSKTGKLVAAVGQPGLSKGFKAGSIIQAAAKAQGRRAERREAGRGLAGRKRGDESGGVKPCPLSILLSFVCFRYEFQVKLFA